jgi:Protein of unknown function (DUF938)
MARALLARRRRLPLYVGYGRSFPESMRKMSDDRQYAPATLQNRDFILDVLRDVLPLTGVILEVASGSGEHFADSREIFRLSFSWVRQACCPAASRISRVIFIGMGDQREMAGLHLDGLGAHPLGHEAFEIGIDRPVFRGNGIAIISAGGESPTKSFTFGRIVGNRGALLRSAGRILWTLMASGSIGPSGLTLELHVSPLRQPSPSRSISTKPTSMMMPGALQAKGCLRMNSASGVRLLVVSAFEGDEPVETVEEIRQVHRGAPKQRQFLRVSLIDVTARR